MAHYEVWDEPDPELGRCGSHEDGGGQLCVVPLFVGWPQKRRHVGLWNKQIIDTMISLKIIKALCFLQFEGKKKIVPAISRSLFIVDLGLEIRLNNLF